MQWWPPIQQYCYGHICIKHSFSEDTGNLGNNIFLVNLLTDFFNKKQQEHMPPMH